MAAVRQLSGGSAPSPARNQQRRGDGDGDMDDEDSPVGLDTVKLGFAKVMEYVTDLSHDGRQQ